MRLLFLMRNLMYLRNYEGLIRALVHNGHCVLIGYEEAREKSPVEIRQAVERLTSDCPGLTLFGIPVRSDRWGILAQQIRVLRDYTRYQHPRYAMATRCRDRAASMVHPTLRRLAFTRASDQLKRAERLAGLARRIEASLPEDPAAAEVIERSAPDLLLVTPLVDFGFAQVDYLKAASRRGIPTGLCVASWDNLTNKSLMPVLPDRVFVWNADQAEEARSLHGVPRERIVITGAQLFDDWFERRPSRSREDFCRQLGLAPDRPLLLYTCSSIFISRLESSFLVRWLTALRTSRDPLLREAGVLIRPHPGSTKQAAQWNDPRLRSFSNVAVHPVSGGYPVTEENRQLYFDSIHHAAAVIGINTSAMLEAAIIGRPCFTIRDAETEQAQDGMLHFEYLTRYGFVRAGEDLAAHLAQLGAVLRNGPGDPERARSVEAFLRPHGLDRPATPILAEAVEAMIGLEPQGLGLPSRSLGLRLLLWPVATTFKALDRQRTGKKWLRQHPTLRHWMRLLSPTYSDGFSGNVWYRLRRQLRRRRRIVLEQVARRLSLRRADRSDNFWYHLRRTRRRSRRLFRIAVMMPGALVRYRSLAQAKRAVVAQVAADTRQGGELV